MPILVRSSAFSRVTALAEQRPLHEAFRWLHLHGQQMMRWQAELIAIPAPPFGEEARSTWMAKQFRQAGLSNVFTDEVGNVFAELSTSAHHSSTGLDPANHPTAHPVVLLSAHLDTVFPADTPLDVRLDNERIEAPGACDNAAGVIGMLAIAHALVDSKMPVGATLIFMGNVGEEGEGDLRGVRHLYQNSSYANRITAHIVLDGAGAEAAVTQALGSRRFQVTIQGPGGHSFTDAGRPNPILVLSLALTRLSEAVLKPDLLSPTDSPRTTVNIGTIEGGTSVNSIPERAVATLDFRSTDLPELVRLEVALHRAVEDAVDLANSATRKSKANGNNGKAARPITFAIDKIGDRPAAELPDDAPLLETLKAVDRHLGLRTDLRLGSTDANIPLSLGVPALSLGAGGEGGAAHTRAEWYSAVNRELGLRRILLLTLAMLDSAAKPA